MIMIVICWEIFFFVSCYCFSLWVYFDFYWAVICWPSFLRCAIKIWMVVKASKAMPIHVIMSQCLWEPFLIKWVPRGLSNQITPSPSKVLNESSCRKRFVSLVNPIASVIIIPSNICSDPLVGQASERMIAHSLASPSTLLFISTVWSLSTSSSNCLSLWDASSVFTSFVSSTTSTAFSV